MANQPVFVISLLLTVISGSNDYSDCKWFGNDTNIPLYPIGICTAHSYETELDNLYLYSTKYECNDNGEMEQAEWNNTDCNGKEYNKKVYRKEDGYYFNCDALTPCPFTKIILWELQNITNSKGKNEGICAFHQKHYWEISIVTNLCIEFEGISNTTFFYIDCDANSVTYSEYSDRDCTIKKYGLGDDEDLFTIDEGCDDIYNINAYVQIAECDDANYNPSSGETTKEKKEHEIAMIFTVIICIIIIILVIMISFYLVNRRNKQSQIAAANIDAQPFNVDFQSIDASDGGGSRRSSVSSKANMNQNSPTSDPEPDSTQQITTQGQDIQEIAITANDQNQMR